MADDTRKKKRGRKTKLNLRSCFPSFANETYSSYSNSNNNKSNDRDLKLGKLITVSSSVCNKNNLITDVEFVNKDAHVNNDCDRDRSSRKRRISRLFKPVFFDSFMVSFFSFFFVVLLTALIDYVLFFFNFKLILS